MRPRRLRRRTPHRRRTGIRRRRRRTGIRLDSRRTTGRRTTREGIRGTTRLHGMPCRRNKQQRHPNHQHPDNSNDQKRDSATPPGTTTNPVRGINHTRTRPHRATPTHPRHTRAITTRTEPPTRHKPTPRITSTKPTRNRPAPATTRHPTHRALPTHTSPPTNPIAIQATPSHPPNESHDHPTTGKTGRRAPRPHNRQDTRHLTPEADEPFITGVRKTCPRR